jgi:hypothetical protein
MQTEPLVPDRPHCQRTMKALGDLERGVVGSCCIEPIYPQQEEMLYGYETTPKKKHPEIPPVIESFQDRPSAFSSVWTGTYLNRILKRIECFV